MRGSVFAIALVVVLVFTGLFFYQRERAGRTEDHRLHVVTTILPLYVFTKNVAGNVADVSNLVPPGTELHDYALSPGDATALVEADVIVKNGYGLDDFVDLVIRTNAKPDRVPMVVDAGVLVDSARPGLGAASPDGAFQVPDSKRLQTKYANPHIWINPAYAVHMVEAIRNGLMKADPQNASAYAVNAEAYLQRLLALDGKYRAAAGSFKNPIFIAEEQTMSYLAQEYRMTEAGILGAEPDASLSPRDVARVVKLMKDNTVKVMFKNASSESKSVEAIAKDAGAKVYVFDPFEVGESSPDAYERVMEANLETLISAFK